MLLDIAIDCSSVHSLLHISPVLPIGIPLKIFINIALRFEHNALDKSGSSTADAKDVTNELGLWNRLFGCQEVNPPE